MDEVNVRFDAFNKYIHFLKPNKNVDLGIIQLGYQQCEPGYGYGPMVRDHFLIHFVKKGSGILQIGNKTYKVVSGECFLIFPHQIAYYESSTDNPWEYYWIGFIGFSAQSFIEQAGIDYNSPIRNILAVNEIFDAFDKIVRGNLNPGNGLLYNSTLYFILHHLTVTADKLNPNSRLIHKRSAKYGQEEYAQIIIKIIETSYKENISIENIAEKLSINRSYLSNLFKNQTGQSIKQYLLTYRLNKAMAKMLDKSKTITEIAMETGFTDPLYFSRIFRQRVGQSPSKYRRNILT